MQIFFFFFFISQSKTIVLPGAINKVLRLHSSDTHLQADVFINPQPWDYGNGFVCVCLSINERVQSRY